MITIIIALIFIVAIYFYNTRNFKYWEKRGVKHDKPIIFFGTGRETFLMRKSITQSFVDLYRKYPNEKVVGFFRSSTPGLLIRDPELIKHVLLTDFVHFYERGIHPDKRGLEPLLSNLFFAEGDLWRLLRQRMTPAFTSGKLKAMFPLIVERAEHLQARALDAARKGKAIDARDLMARYTTDFIGACGFGLDAGSLNEEESAFRKLGADIFKFDLRQVVVNVLKENFPRLTRQLKFLGHLENQIVTLVNDIQKQRNYQPSNRNDFIDLLLECKKKGIIKVESLEKVKPDGSPDYATLELDDLLIAAQVFVFFAAGFETSSSATSYTLHQLAYYPEVQKKVQADIDAVLSKHDNKLSYEAVKDMTYLDWTFREGMRKFPSLGYLARRCSRKYTFTDLNLTIDEGVMISIPLQALQTDPQYFDNPTEFRPERFDPKNGLANKFTYLPFGDGPRACIGERLGLMQSLAGLAAILSRFSVEPAPESHPVDPPVEPKFDVVQSVIDGLPLRFIERKKVE